MDHTRHLEVVLKLTERCNINCTYCYYFNGSNDDYSSKPKAIAQSTVEAIADFLAEAVITKSITTLQIDLHGGEPLLIGKRRFKATLAALSTVLVPICDLRLTIQTNGMLIDDEWIHLFETFGVHVGVSLDGHQLLHDQNRVGFDGKGTYFKTLEGLRKLKSASLSGTLQYGALCVITKGADGGEVFRHFVDDLELCSMNFLEPDTTRDCADPESVAAVRQFMMSAIEAWRHTEPGQVQVRAFDTVMSRLLSGRDNATTDDDNDVIITIRSDGQIDPEDDLRNARPDVFGLGFNVFEHSLDDFLQSPAILRLHDALSCLPTQCESCGFKNVCQGGRLFSNGANRYSLANGFQNRSVYCDSYQLILLEMTRHLLDRGVPWNNMAPALANP